MGRYALDMEKYADLARTASAEGCVLLKNDNSTLPLKKGDKVAVFGRMAFHYYKSGLGSGGLVNTRYVVGILDALRACKDIALDEELIGIYEKWIKDHPYDEGEGWGLVPWSQEEMPVTEEMLQTASGDDVGGRQHVLVHRRGRLCRLLPRDRQGPRHHLRRSHAHFAGGRG